MVVFSKEKYTKERGIQRYTSNKDWVDLCDGKEVVDGEVTLGPSTYKVANSWCRDTNETQGESN